MGAVVAVIVWQLDLQLPMQCCEFESWPGRGAQCDKVCQ